MLLTMLKGKIHRAVITESNLHYVGSITIDEALLEHSGINEYEQVDIVDIENGSRLTTYVIRGERDSGVICLNGAAARLVCPGDHIIIMSYAQMTPEEASTHKPRVVFVDQDNQVVSVEVQERHGEIR
ncbi:MAG: aspartate 1-decarboxylase [Burkholderiaceae bacterium]|nr:aspartate 1-decarboxylase [Burkholderiaceae bacterium]